MYRMKNRDCHVPRLEKAVDPEDLERSATTLLGVTGMGCPNCAMRVRNSLLSRKGVLDVHIDLPYGLARVAYDPASTGDQELLDAVAAAGNDRHTYQAVLISG
ncbi:MAG: hypothetical protein GWN32_05900 [Gemmatimonadetes bacterium]|nr:hypothetical protein [Gemmatimonadota bacterium]